MFPTRCLPATARVHTPLIHFLGKRAIPKDAHVPAPHPAAPPEIRTTFGEFRRKFKSYAGPTSRKGGQQEGTRQYNNIWEAPPRFWRSRLVITETEMEAVMSGGALR